MTGPARTSFRGPHWTPAGLQARQELGVVQEGLLAISLAQLGRRLGLRPDRLGALIRQHRLMPGHRKGTRYRFTARDAWRIASHPKIEAAARRAQAGRAQGETSGPDPEWTRAEVEPMTREREASSPPRIELPDRAPESSGVADEPMVREPDLTRAEPETLTGGPEASQAEVEPAAHEAEVTPAEAVARAPEARPIEIAPAYSACRAFLLPSIAPAAALLLTAGGVFLWALALSAIDVSRMTDAGLVSVLPAPVFVALGLVTAGFLTSLHFRPVGPLLLIHVAALVVILFGTTSIVEHVPHISATWRHVGIVDYLDRTHHVETDIDAYFNWPGFFVFSAFVADVAGIKTTIDFARWAPLVYDLLFLLPVFLIARAGSTDRRLIWTTVWMFSITNWVAQDYFSPQAMTYLLYLVAVALLLSWFTAGAPVAATAFAASGRVFTRLRSALRVASVGPSKGTAVQRVLLLLVLIAVAAAIIPSHQLTPFALFAAVTGLVAVRSCSARGLPLLVLVMLAAWVVFMTGSFLSGHFGSVAGSVGQVDKNVSSSLGGRLHGSPEHLLVVFTRVAMTGGLWLLALVGFLRRLRRGYRDLQLAVLALAPFLLIALQSYGGEILLRIYLFALPFMAFFIAAVFFTAAKASGSWRASLALAVASAVLVGGFLVSRYGNERTDYFTQAEVGADAYINRVAPKGALVVSLTRDYPRKFVRYEQFKYSFVSELPRWHDLDVSEAPPRAAVDLIRRTMNGTDPRRSYLIVTRSQVADLETFSDVRRGWLENLVRQLRRSPDFRAVYAHPDAFVLQLRNVRVT